jgi:hypothetical protein
MRQRLWPSTAGARQGPPLRVLAPQRGLASIGAVWRAWSLIPALSFCVHEFVCLFAWIRHRFAQGHRRLKRSKLSSTAGFSACHAEAADFVEAV